MVGAKGFEPSTPWSQTRCATRLRYAPTFSKLICLDVDLRLKLYTKQSHLSRIFKKRAFIALFSVFWLKLNQSLSRRTCCRKRLFSNSSCEVTCSSSQYCILHRFCHLNRIFSLCDSRVG